MKKFNSLQKTNFQKRKYNYDYSKIYRKGKFATSVDYTFFENQNSKILLEANAKKKINSNLITLWATLDIRSYIDFDLGNTINLYFVNSHKPTPIKDLQDYNYMYEPARKLNLLDIKYIKSIKINASVFKKLYLATYEIMDRNNMYRPYVLLFILNENSNKFEQIGYGYDSNDNGNIELFIDSFNYPLFLTPKGTIKLPLANKNVKLKVYDYITDVDIQKIMSKKTE